MTDSSNPPPRWFQFTIHRILAATFWIAVCFGAFILSRDYKPDGKDPGTVIGVAIIVVIALSPFVAVGTLFGRPMLGGLVGISLITIYVLAVVIGIHMGWIPFDP